MRRYPSDRPEFLSSNAALPASVRRKARALVGWCWCISLGFIRTRILRQASRREKGSDSSIKQFYAALHRYLSASPEDSILGELRRMAVRAVDAARMSGMA